MRIAARANTFQISGDDDAVDDAVQLIKQLYLEVQGGAHLSPESVHLHLQKAGLEQISQGDPGNPVVIHTKKGSIKPRGGNQQRYVRAIRECDINFGIGPAGTGKTYLAVACAVEALLGHGVQRILLVRPAVEAGEKLGFLPGDLAQKIDPYLRPLYDALYEMIGVETVTKLIERNVIEIAPLAYMRGRTLNDSFIILDEAQNTTREQMKMFLTRIGFGSTAVITGDATQIDLPRGTPSGLLHVMQVLKDIEGISVNYFESRDVVRHPLVQRVVEAYAAFDEQHART
ncbi:PhoH family protein [Spongiibacter taiwanensis]